MSAVKLKPVGGTPKILRHTSGKRLFVQKTLEARDGFQELQDGFMHFSEHITFCSEYYHTPKIPQLLGKSDCFSHPHLTGVTHHTFDPGNSTSIFRASAKPDIICRKRSAWEERSWAALEVSSEIEELF